MDNPEVNRPEGGRENAVPLSVIANRYASSKPNQNTGMDTPILAIIIVKVSTSVFRRRAETMPRLTPTTVEKIIATMVSSMVSGSRSAMTSTTGREKRMEVPRSP